MQNDILTASFEMYTQTMYFVSNLYIQGSQWNGNIHGKINCMNRFGVKLNWP